MSAHAILIDTTLCTGCKACQGACASLNALPFSAESKLSAEYSMPESLSATAWNRVACTAEPGSGRLVMRVEMCNHCNDAACISACPERAIGKQDGWSVIDIGRCIGCGSCEIACPYNAVHVLSKKTEGMKAHRAYKCHGCIPAGLDRPECVSVCPTGALTYGNRLRMLKRGRERVASLKKEFPAAGLTGSLEAGGMQVLTIHRDMKHSKLSVSRHDGFMRMENILYAIARPFTAGSEKARRVLQKTVRSMFDV